MSWYHDFVSPRPRVISSYIIDDVCIVSNGSTDYIRCLFDLRIPMQGRARRH